MPKCMSRKSFKHQKLLRVAYQQITCFSEASPFFIIFIWNYNFRNLSKQNSFKVDRALSVLLYVPPEQLSPRVTMDGTMMVSGNGTMRNDSSEAKKSWAGCSGKENPQKRKYLTNIKTRTDLRKVTKCLEIYMNTYSYVVLNKDKVKDSLAINAVEYIFLIYFSSSE